MILNHLLYSCQSCFRPKDPCADKHIQIIQSNFSAVDGNFSIKVLDVSLDLPKAFENALEYKI